jgi:hypothetical protein
MGPFKFNTLLAIVHWQPVRFVLRLVLNHAHSITADGRPLLQLAAVYNFGETRGESCDCREPTQVGPSSNPALSLAVCEQIG